MINSNKICFGFLLLAFISLTGLTGAAQVREKSDKYDRKFCANNWSNGGKVSTSDLREMTVAAGDVNVDGKRNGGISIRGENRSDVLVRACVQAWANSEVEANSLAKSVRIETGGTIKAVGAEDEKNFSVSYEILVPRNTNLNLTATNGGISISNVEGNINFTASNGGVSLSDLAGDVKGKTSNGGLKVELTGNSWKGVGLDVKTTNGGIHVSMSENYAARIETRTTNGGFNSEIAALKIERDPNNWKSGANLSRDINGGGATIRLITTNGGVRIESSN
ncbi:MAG: DUF4097 domain-containing protein [Acidobacteriota bacterium]|nr:DUF4097 domain-containing protein [Acidobacteriota bacterium]